MAWQSLRSVGCAVAKTSDGTKDTVIVAHYQSSDNSENERAVMPLNDTGKVLCMLQVVTSFKYGRVSLFRSRYKDV